MHFCNHFMVVHFYIFPRLILGTKVFFFNVFLHICRYRGRGGGEVTCFTFQRVKENSGGIARLFHHRDRKTERDNSVLVQHSAFRGEPTSVDWRHRQFERYGLAITLTYPTEGQAIFLIHAWWLPPATALLVEAEEGDSTYTRFCSTVSYRLQYIPLSTCEYTGKVPKQNSWMYNFVDVSGHNLESYQSWGWWRQELDQRWRQKSDHWLRRQVSDQGWWQKSDLEVTD